MMKPRTWLTALACAFLPVLAHADDKILFSGYDSSGWGLWTATLSGDLTRLYEGEFRGAVATAGVLAYADPAGRIYTRPTADRSAEPTEVAGLPIPCGQPTLSPDASTLVVACFRFAHRQDDGAFYTIDLKDRSWRLLLDDPGLQKSAVFSPDGTRIAFVSGFRLSADRVIEHVWVMNADGSDATAIANTSDVNIDPTWLDNDRLVISSDHDGQGVKLWQVTLQDGKMKPLTLGPSDLEVAANGNDQVVFVGDRDDGFGLWLMDLADPQSPRHLAVTPQDGLQAAHDPFWTKEY